jgi:hypothetical protein
MDFIIILTNTLFTFVAVALFLLISRTLQEYLLGDAVLIDNKKQLIVAELLIIISVTIAAIIIYLEYNLIF